MARAVDVDGVIEKQNFSLSRITVLQAPLWPCAKGFQQLGRTWLGYAGVAQRGVA